MAVRGNGSVFYANVRIVRLYMRFCFTA